LVRVERVMALLIPRVFHQVWLGSKPMPGKFREWAERWAALNAGWRVEWWTDERLPELVNRKEFEGADKMAAKSDILRYEICWKHGGIYVDSDVEPLRPIGELLEGVNAFYGDERPDTPCNAILGCVAGDGFFGHLVKKLPESFREEGDIVDKTGPRFLKRELEAYLGEKRRYEWDWGMRRRLRVSSEDGARQVFGFDWRVFYPYYYTEPQREWDQYPEAYARHHWTASWWKDGGV
jgi:mannosyltransferase OCH1-like enzyme